MFSTNVGSIDRALRIIVGLALLALFFFVPGAPWRYFTLIGIIPLLTGLMSTCPLYSVFGINTCPLKKN